MRSVGIALSVVLVAAVALQAQPPAAPGLPPVDPGLDAHLVAWEKVMGKATNFSAKFEQTKVEATFKKERKYTGSILCMKPNDPKLSLFARMNLANVKDKNDFEAYICNGKSLFHYDWAGKTVTEIPLAQGNGDSLMLEFMSGMKAAAVKQRFHLTQFNPADKNYVYFDIKPKLQNDQQEFAHIRLAVFGPNVPPPFIPYLPAQIFRVMPNDDTESWKFSEQAVDVKGIGPEVFQYKAPEEKGWQFKKAPLAPMGPTVPAKGAVRP